MNKKEILMKIAFLKGFETAYEHVHTAAEALQDSGFVDDVILLYSFPK